MGRIRPYVHSNKTCGLLATDVHSRSFCHIHWSLQTPTIVDDKCKEGRCIIKGTHDSLLQTCLNPHGYAGEGAVQINGDSVYMIIDSFKSRLLQWRLEWPRVFPWTTSLRTSCSQRNKFCTRVGFCNTALGCISAIKRLPVKKMYLEKKI